MIVRGRTGIPALTGDRERTSYVYLPVGYGDGERRYPVMYMFDGQNLFDDAEATYGKSWGLADYLDYTETPLIIAAAECNTEGDMRLSEYSPADFTAGGKRITGHGKEYMDWLTGSFKPQIDANFRTLPDRESTAIGGSSMGGLMSLYAAAEYGEYFSKFAALSPSLWACGGGISFLRDARMRTDVRIFMDYGSAEFGNHAGQRRLFGSACRTLIEKGVCLTCRVVPGGTHSEETWACEVPYFMNALGFKPGR